MMMNATKPGSGKHVIQSGLLDRSEAMVSFLKEQKFLKELSKGVQSMKTFVYPSVLQKQAIPALKKGAARNVIIRYRELNGIKLTVMLPMLHNQIKFAILEQAKKLENPSADDDKVVVSLILCHSQMRTAAQVEFARELTAFCSEIVEIVNFDELTIE